MEGPGENKTWGGDRLRSHLSPECAGQDQAGLLLGLSGKQLACVVDTYSEEEAGRRGRESGSTIRAG